VEIDEGLTARSEVASEIISIWPGVAVVSSAEEELPAGTEGLLVVGQGRNRSKESLLLVENVAAIGLGMEQLMFQINANLGKMIAADLVKTTTPRPFDEDAQYSRRDLFSGFRSPGSFPKTYSTAPVIYNAICEARYGCSKCVEACPTQALSIANGSVVLKEQDCSRLGLCTSVCPVSAIQLPRYSESQFQGLIYGIARTNQSASKMLVLTCDRNVPQPEPWMFIEQVDDIGTIGTRQLAMALGSGIDKVIVHCADGACSGKVAASRAVESIRSLIENRLDANETPLVRYLEGEGAKEEIVKIYNIPSGQYVKPQYVFGSDAWANYINALKQIASPQGSTLGLGLTNLNISDTCTLCQVCEKYCPHSALRVVSGSLEFDSSKCTGCGYCAQICPEHSITLLRLERVTDVESRAVFQDEIVNCARCNQPLGSATYMKNVKARLGKEDPMMKYCNSCKQQIAVEKMFGKQSEDRRSSEKI
jgi:ferredoxin